MVPGDQGHVLSWGAPSAKREAPDTSVDLSHMVVYLYFPFPGSLASGAWTRPRWAGQLHSCDGPRAHLNLSHWHPVQDRRTSERLKIGTPHDPDHPKILKLGISSTQQFFNWHNGAIPGFSRVSLCFPSLSSNSPSSATTWKWTRLLIRQCRGRSAGRQSQLGGGLGSFHQVGLYQLHSNTIVTKVTKPYHVMWKIAKDFIWYHLIGSLHALHVLTIPACKPHGNRMVRMVHGSRFRLRCPLASHGEGSPPHAAARPQHCAWTNWTSLLVRPQAAEPWTATPSGDLFPLRKAPQMIMKWPWNDHKFMDDSLMTWGKPISRYFKHIYTHVEVYCIYTLYRYTIWIYVGLWLITLDEALKMDHGHRRRDSPSHFLSHPTSAEHCREKRASRSSSASRT